MNPEAGTSISLWMTTCNLPDFHPLAEDLECDVCVIGAGITGLSAAYYLAKSGKRVVVLEDGPVCGGETQRTTAHLTDVVDDRFANLAKAHGVDAARLVYESHRDAIAAIERNIADNEIFCDFKRVNGYLFNAENDSFELKSEMDALQNIGYAGVQWLDEMPLQGIPIQTCLEFANQAQFNPLKYLTGLMRVILNHNGKILTRTRVKSIEDGTIANVETESGHTVKASYVVIATNSPIGDRVRVHTKQHAYRTYALGAEVFKGSIPEGLYWDTEDPYHYVRLQKLDNNDEYEVLIVGGEDHRTGMEPDYDPYQNLEAWAKKWFIGVQDIMFKWSGQVYEPVDGLSFIGRDPAYGENVFLATGDSGMGMTHGTMAGSILHDLIVGRFNKYAELYDPARKSVQEAGEFIKQNVSGLAGYFDYATPGDVKSTDDIAPGDGAIIRKGLEKQAVYKDAEGYCHKMSAVCPHLKGLVRWNSQEKTWDCPLHGSRFDAMGCVVNGPANSNLEALANDEALCSPEFDASPDAEPIAKMVQSPDVKKQGFPSSQDVF
ncbi:MAG: FAD-dependent oxidoreductase [Candidatus Obscuribacterales bacterium]|nr:FAD-dependent oxidoreductase [Candidatus Obscuribacterales bacterium]